jgi:hypothetical protein
MESDPLLFGDVFLYRDEEYIFLGATDVVWYAAKVITVEQTKRLCEFYLRALRKNNPRIDIMPLYCFVELQTKDFCGRAAYFNDTQRDKYLEIPKPLGIQLDLQDKKAIRDVVLKDKSPVPIGLIEIVNKIKLD